MRIKCGSVSSKRRKMHKENRPGNQKAAGELDSDVGVVGDDGKQSLPTLNAFSQRRKKTQAAEKEKEDRATGSHNGRNPKRTTGIEFSVDDELVCCCLSYSQIVRSILKADIYSKSASKGQRYFFQHVPVHPYPMLFRS